MVSTADPPRLPTIDLSLFDLGDPWRDQVAAQIDAAGSEFGCFCLVGHGIDAGVVAPVIAAERSIFAGGACAPADSEFREPVLEHLRSLAGLSHKLMAMIARGLQLPDSFFVDRYTGSPALAFQLVRHAPRSESYAAHGGFGDDRVDARFLTILQPDTDSSWEFNYRGAWIAAPAMPGSLICSVGDGLARLTGGRYVPCTQRVRNTSAAPGLSLSFAFAPAGNAVLEPIATRPATAEVAARADLPADAAHRRIA